VFYWERYGYWYAMREMYMYVYTLGYFGRMGWL
jgi:hypothetical protein